jgi:predicted DNA repair protein MutK
MLHRKDEHRGERDLAALATPPPPIDPVALEKDKIKGAIRTDFVLSAEIIAITLGTVADASFPTRVAVLVGIAIIMTVGVYGLVAGIVKLDDAGLYLSQKRGEGIFARMQRSFGAGILSAAPWLMKGLSIAGTAAMFLVGGGILVHGLPFIHHAIEELAQRLAALPGAGDVLGGLAPIVLNGLAGVVAGAIVLALVGATKRLLRPATTEA